MPKNKITDYDVVPTNNTDVDGGSIDPGSSYPKDAHLGLAGVMSHLAKMASGADPLPDTVIFSDPADPTRRVRLDVGNVEPGQTRILRVPDQDVDLTSGSQWTDEASLPADGSAIQGGLYSVQRNSTEAELYVGNDSNNAIRVAMAPAGAVFYSVSQVALPGTLLANGSVVSRTVYADLDAALYVGDALNGTALFGYRCTDSDNADATRSITGSFIVLPDLRGEFIRVYDGGRGIDTGRAWTSFQDEQVGDHRHSIRRDNIFTGTGSLNAARESQNLQGTHNDYLTSGIFDISGSRIEEAKNRPRNIPLNVCIKY